MKKTGLCFILMIFWIGVFAQIQVKKSASKKYLCFTLLSHRSLWNGEQYYEVLNDSLYVFQKQLNYIPYGSSQQYIDSIKSVKKTPKILESYPIHKNDLLALDSLFETIDSFGYHAVNSELVTARQFPEFYISGRYKGKEMGGYTINCYRENIHAFIDWLNKIYPKGEVLGYNKEELISREQNIKLHHEKILKAIKRKNNK